MAPDGSFTFEFATRLGDGTQVLTGPATIEITAEDWNGNASSANVTIVRSSTGDFSTVTVSPGNKHATVEWEPVLHAQSYNIYELEYGEVREAVTSPYTWDSLENGEVYVFQLEALLPVGVGENAYSTPVGKMPMSTHTIAPWIRQVGFESITIEWPSIPGVDKYTVERSLSPVSPWSVRRNLEASVFVDDRVELEQAYFYRVSPADYPDIASEFAGATSSRFSEVSVYPVMSATDIGGTSDCIDVQWPYAYQATSTPTRRFVVTDITDLGNPVVRGGFDIAATANPYGITVSGSYA